MNRDEMALVQFQYDDEEVSIFGIPGDYIFEKIVDRKSFYEEDLLRFLSSIPINKGVFVDVGANIGNHSIFFTKLMGRKTYAFEVSPYIREILNENRSINGVEENLSVFDFGLFSRTTLATLSQSSENLGMTRILSVDGDQDNQVPLRALDEVFPAGEDLALIKIDVEGVELEVLRGASATISKNRPICVLEVHGAAAARRTAEFFASIDYLPLGIAGLSDNWIMVHADEIDRFEPYASAFLRRQDRRELLHLKGREVVGSNVLGTMERRLVAVGRQLAATEPQLATMGRQLATMQPALEKKIDNAKNAISTVSAKINEVKLELARVSPDLKDVRLALAESLTMNVRRLEDKISLLMHRALEESSRERVEIDRLRKLNRDLTARARREAETMREQLAAESSKRIARLEQELGTLRKQSETGKVVTAAWHDYARKLYGTRGFKAQRRALLYASRLGLTSNVTPFAEMEKRIAALGAPKEVPAIEKGPKRRGKAAVAPAKTAAPVFEVHVPDVSHLRQAVDGRVRVGIATIPSRRDALRLTVESLLPQADEICVALNGYDAVPDFLVHPKITAVRQDNLGDRAKFQFLEGFDGYYFVCDDDIAYPPYYIDYCIGGIERYQRKAVVGWHGSIIREGFESYYEKSSRSVYTFGSVQRHDRFVHVLGTGVSAFHTDTIRPTLSDFPRPSLADIYLALMAKEKGVAMVMLAHGAREAKAISIENDISISGASIARSENELNVREFASDLIRKAMPFASPESLAPAHTRPLKVALVGRTSEDRWKRGGVYKSCRLMGDQIESLGWSVTYIEIEHSIEDNKKLLSKDYDVVLFYTGDQVAQDYFPVEELVSFAIEKGHVCVANLSYNLQNSRSQEIAAFFDKIGSTRLHLMAFSPEVARDPELARYVEQITIVPKTIEIGQAVERPFTERSGIFIGDVGKLADERLTPNAGGWLEAIREALPGQPIYAINQYQGSRALPDFMQGVTVLPYGNVYELFARMRMYVHLNRFCTFEMMPVEAMSAGLPVAYIDMPQSLNHYIAEFGARFSTEHELILALQSINHNEQIWSTLSVGGIQRGKSLQVDRTAGWLAQALLRAINLNRS